MPQEISEIAGRQLKLEQELPAVIAMHATSSVGFRFTPSRRADSPVSPPRPVVCFRLTLSHFRAERGERGRRGSFFPGCFFLWNLAMKKYQILEECGRIIESADRSGNLDAKVQAERDEAMAIAEAVQALHLCVNY